MAKSKKSGKIGNGCKKEKPTFCKILKNLNKNSARITTFSSKKISLIRR